MNAALNLADALADEVVRTVALDVLHSEAAAELRRLHALNAELLEALTDVIGWVPGAHWHTDAPIKSVERARLAIRKAWEAT